MEHHVGPRRLLDKVVDEGGAEWHREGNDGVLHAPRAQHPARVVTGGSKAGIGDSGRDLSPTSARRGLSWAQIKRVGC